MFVSRLHSYHNETTIVEIREPNLNAALDRNPLRAHSTRLALAPSALGIQLYCTLHNHIHTSNLHVLNTFWKNHSTRTLRGTPAGERAGGQVERTRLPGLQRSQRLQGVPLSFCSHCAAFRVQRSVNPLTR